MGGKGEGSLSLFHSTLWDVISHKMNDLNRMKADGFIDKN